MPVLGVTEIVLLVLLAVIAVLGLAAIRQRRGESSGTFAEPVVSATFGPNDDLQPAGNDYDGGEVDEDDEASLDDLLADLLADPEGVEHVIVQGRRGFVQFVATPRGGLYAEAVSSAYLLGNDALSPTEQARILGLGWTDGGPQRNYSLEFDPPVDVTRAADLAEATLDVYGDNLTEASIETA